MCSCDKFFLGRSDAYDREMAERNALTDDEKRVEETLRGIRKKASKIPVFVTTRPDEPFIEVGLISVETSDIAATTQLNLQVEAFRCSADGVIITGHHLQDQAFRIRVDYTDAVAITWKQRPTFKAGIE